MSRIILAIDTSDTVLGVAVSRENVPVAERYIDCGLKHSVKLMTAVDGCLADANVDIEDVDVFAVVAGPGSFTGIRIGVCTVKAFCHATGKPGIALNALDVLAVGGREYDMNVCSLVDARRGQVYASMYDKNGVNVFSNFAGDISELTQCTPKKTVLTGSGAVANRAFIEENFKDPVFMPHNLVRGRASNACLLACESRLVTYDKIEPIYVRMSGAERMKGG